MDGSRIPPTGQLTLALDRDRYETLAASRGWTTNDEHARGLQLSIATVSRMRAGIQTPGASLIAALLRAFPDEGFADLFEIVSAESERAAS